MKMNCTQLFGFFSLVLFAFMLQGCMVTEECTREGLNVYTNNWPEQNWHSTCIAGMWVDVPVSDHSDDVFQIFPNCKVVLCYDGITDCECSNDIYPVEERDSK